MLSVFLTIGAHFTRNPVWVNRGWGAAGACALIAVTTGLISVARSRFVPKESEAPQTRSLAALAVRQAFQSPSNDWVKVWLLVSIKAHDLPLSIVRWQISIKWENSEHVTTNVFRNTHDLTDDGSLWWQGTHFAKNLAWGNLALVPKEQVDGFLHFAFKNAAERKLSGRMEEVCIEITDIAGDSCATKWLFPPLQE